MEYYKTYRPKDLDTFVGDKIKKQVIGLFDKGYPHATLLTSTAPGTGKTTLARIIADGLDCAKSAYIEIDSVESSGVDFVRELRETIHYPPLDGDIKVYLFDEVHRASQTAQDCLLKCLEECPKHVYFILATTEAEKLLPALKSRCVHLTLEGLSRDEIAKKVLYPVAKAEKLNVTKEVLLAIGENCKGSARNALTMLERVATLEPDQQMAEIALTDATMPTDIRELCKALLAGKPFDQCIAYTKNIVEEPEKVRRCVIGYMNSVLINSGKQRAYEIIRCFEKNYFDTAKVGLTVSIYEATSEG
jgi:DNA polymerase III gamma/tau subunit